jgi:type I restriction enzyme M protein
LITGVAGNPTDTFLKNTRYLKNGKWHRITINGKDLTGFLSPEIAQTVMASGPEIQDVPIDERLFLSKAEKINEYLHIGAINKNYRARVMASLLLALIDDTPPDVNATPTILIKDINARAQHQLKIHNKSEFYQYIEIALPPTEDNHTKFKTAIVQTIQELNNLNIRSAMNSGADVLGKFYEVFLKYGNGAKDIGIVLTPRHITRFAAEVASISANDVLYDPACGTAGFLVAAFDDVKRNYSASKLDQFRQYQLFGVDQDTEVVALAIVNMIFPWRREEQYNRWECFSEKLDPDQARDKILNQATRRF